MSLSRIDPKKYIGPEEKHMHQIWIDFKEGNPTRKFSMLADAFGICGVSLALFVAPFFAGIDVRHLDKYFVMVAHVLAGGLFTILTLTLVSVLWTLYDESPRFRLFPRLLYRAAAAIVGMLAMVYIGYRVYLGILEVSKW